MDILSVVNQEVQEIFSQVVNDASVSVETLEASVVRACRELGRKVLETCLSESAAESDSVSVSCPACGGEAWRFRQRGCYIETLCGVVRVYRWVYRCACGASVVPWQSREGLKDGAYTLGVAKTMCRLAARLDFREAAEELKHHGVRVSHTTLQDKVQRWASGESVSAYVDEQSLDPGAKWYVSCDGCHTASVDGWQEVKVGCLYRGEPHGSSGSIPSTRSSSLWYVASRFILAMFIKEWGLGCILGSTLKNRMRIMTKYLHTPQKPSNRFEYFFKTCYHRFWIYPFWVSLFHKIPPYMFCKVALQTGAVRRYFIINLLSFSHF